MTKIEIPLTEVEEGIFGQSHYRLDLKFYSPKLKKSYRNFLAGRYPLKLVKDVAPAVKRGIKTEENDEYAYLQIGDIDRVFGEVKNTSPF
jgi:hypothetical protein